MVLPYTLEVVAVALVDVTVRHQCGMIPVHQAQEDLKAAMGEVFVVAQLIGGRMSEQDVKTPVPQELRP